MEKAWLLQDSNTDNRQTDKQYRRGRITLHKLNGVERRDWRGNKKRVKIVKLRSNKRINSCFKTGLSEMGVKMLKIMKSIADLLRLM